MHTKIENHKKLFNAGIRSTGRQQGVNLQRGKTQHEKLLARGNFNANDRGDCVFFSLKIYINILNTKNTEIEYIWGDNIAQKFKFLSENLTFKQSSVSRCYEYDNIGVLLPLKISSCVPSKEFAPNEYLVHFAWTCCSLNALQKLFGVN